MPINFSTGSKINFPGTPIGLGLNHVAALELGLKAGTPVGVSLIDAYAGALGLLACHADVPLEQRLGKNKVFITWMI